MTEEKKSEPNLAEYDIIVYAGEINNSGYELVSSITDKPTSKRALVVLFTPGGDPHAGFRIARALHCSYGEFDLLIPRTCKSAGSLIAIGAHTLFLDDMSELGPLDVQLKKKDEIVGLTSGLDIVHSVNHVQTQAMHAFRTYLVELSAGAGLSTKVAADIASKLTTGLYQPIVAQIDPMKLAEIQRALEIAFAYGERLNEKSSNLKPGALAELVTSYPSHSFVIDRKEAKKLFFRVEKPTGFMQELSKAIKYAFEKCTYDQKPFVQKVLPKPGEKDETVTSDADATSVGLGETKPEDNGNRGETTGQLLAEISRLSPKTTNRKKRGSSGQS